MKIISYIGAESETIVIEQPTDIYPLLDWCQSKMIELQENAKGSVNVEKWEKASNYLSKLMEQVEKDGFGNQDDIDNITN
jgi:hypothetical protein